MKVRPSRGSLYVSYWLFVLIIIATERRAQQCTRPVHNKTAVDLAKVINSHLRCTYGNVFDLTEAQVRL